MRKYAKPNLEIILIGNDADIITTSPANDNLFNDTDWEHVNFGFED